MIPGINFGHKRPSNGRNAPKVWPAYDPTIDPIDNLLERLEGVYESDRRQWAALCPAHPDSQPSLSVAEADEMVVLVHCHAGCTVDEIMAAVGLKKKHLFPSPLTLFISHETGRRRTSADRNQRNVSRTMEANSPGAVLPDPKMESLYRTATYAQQCNTNLAQLAAHLGVSTWSLQTIGVGTLAASWSFPEFDGHCQIVGIVERYPDGRKKALSGSRRGLTLPMFSLNGTVLPPGDLYIAEGASDTAALLAAGLNAIGRPMASLTSAVETFLADIFRLNPSLHVDRNIVVIGDNDVHDAGRKGALSTRRFLQQILCKPIFAALPAGNRKDIREQIIAGQHGLVFLPADA